MTAVLLKNSGRLKMTVAFVTVVIFVISLLTVMRWDHPIVNGLFFFGYVFFIWIFPIASIALVGGCLYQYRHTKQTRLYIFVPVIAIVGSCAILVLWLFFIPTPALAISELLCAIAISSVFAYLFCWRKDGPSILKVLPISLTIVFFMIVPIFLSAILPYIYSPQVLTVKTIPLYKACIKFAENNSKYDDIILGSGYWWSPKYDLGYARYQIFRFGTEHLKGKITEEEYSRISQDARHLSKKLNGIVCEKMQRNSNILLFFKNKNHILPSGPGVAYSLNGDNPNNLHSDIIDAAKPFIHLSGNWYLSRNLVLGGRGTHIQTSVPNALTDYSLSLDGVDANELKRFD